MGRRKDLLDLYTKGEIWSPMRCVRCEMLLAFNINMVPKENIRKPLFHLHAGGGKCVLCTAEGIAKSNGVPRDFSDHGFSIILRMVINECSKASDSSKC